MDTIGFFTSEEKKLFFSKYRLLLRNLYSFLEREDIRKMKELMKRVVALDCYGRDKNGINGLLRNIDTALIATLEIGLKRTSVIALLLYRPVLKKAITIEEVEQKFGADVTLIIRRLLKTSDLYARNTAVNSENFHHLLFSFAEDVRVILLMIADRLCLMRMGKQMQEDDRIRLATEASYLYAPLAHRLGLYTIKSELEDLSLKYTDRKQYDFIKRKLNETKRSRDAYIAEFIAPIKRKLAAAGFKFDIKGRTKSIHSINNKLKKQQVEFEGIYDLFAIRIVLDTPLEKERSECWQVYSIVTDMYQPNPKRMKDWISIPKTNGYESLHITVMGPQNKWVEVQIRTQRMEEIAERGFAAHWKYKNASLSNNEDELDRWLKKIRDALNGPTENAVDFLDNFKLSLYTSEIAVFTPKGEARKMPYGATALDFAYDIHSKIGNSAIGAKINHKIEPITTQINSGDQIEIITADNARPKAEWLDIVTTTKAKQAIKSFLKRERQNNIERGMKMLEERMQQLNTPLSGRVLRKIVPIYESNNKEELYSKIGAGIVDLKDLDKVLKVNATSKILKFWTLFINKKEDEEGDDAENPEPNSAKAEESATAGEPQFVMAECCKPIPGDSVVGYKDPASHRIIVHKSNCKELDRLAAQFGRNILKDEIKWSQHKAMSYLSTIELRGIDRTGILLDLAKTVSEDFSINIRQINIQTHDNIFEGTISLYVKDAEGLHAIMDKIRKIKGIDTVKRNQD